MEPARAALPARSVDDLLDGLLTVALEEDRLRDEGYHRGAAGHRLLGVLLRGELVRRVTP